MCRIFPSGAGGDPNRANRVNVGNEFILMLFHINSQLFPHCNIAAIALWGNNILLLCVKDVLCTRAARPQRREEDLSKCNYCSFMSHGVAKMDRAVLNYDTLSSHPGVWSCLFEKDIYIRLTRWRMAHSEWRFCSTLWSYAQSSRILVWDLAAQRKVTSASSKEAWVPTVHNWLFTDTEV